MSDRDEVVRGPNSGPSGNQSSGSVSSAIKSAKTIAVDAIPFGARFAASGKFEGIFKEGMALVERTAAYLDGPGRKEAKGLQAPLTLIYATESMRLTTRLLEVASWLMIHRALKDGEIDNTQADRRRQRVKLTPLGRPQHVKNFTDLPAGLKALVSESFALNDRILQLDRAFTSGSPADAAPRPVNPVSSQLARIEAAFGRHTLSS
jgi:regulator of CtrA degradation